jgi:hypothetical protein
MKKLNFLSRCAKSVRSQFHNAKQKVQKDFDNRKVATPKSKRNLLIVSCLLALGFVGFKAVPTDKITTLSERLVDSLKAFLSRTKTAAPAVVVTPTPQSPRRLTKSEIFSIALSLAAAALDTSGFLLGGSIGAIGRLSYLLFQYYRKKP